ncbi:hypothetical protein M758_4G104800 [Ceratodon purpureus]|nr:hypothetical protein M758_4G104800 [Ceratodon purpureus]
MGVCLSRCGETHNQVGPAAISQRNYSFDNTESLKKFLHLQGAVKSSHSSSPRTSLGGLSQNIPHSSELFSLPASEPDRSSFAVSPSPGRTSRASVSSHITSFSPKGRRSCSWGGRFSVEKTSTGCRKRIRPALRVEQDLAAHQRLIEAIARLERLNDGKQLELRVSSASDLDPTDTTKAPQHNASRSRHVRHYQLPLQLPKSTLCPPNTATTTPVIPLANSFSNFLREVESYVSLIEAPRVSSSSEAIAVSKNGRPVSKAISRLANYRCDETDSDDMFTFFEATSSEDGEVRKKRSPISTSLHRLVQSVTQVHPVENLSPVAEKAPTAQLSKPSSGNRSTKQSRTVTANIDIVDPCIESMRVESGEEATGATLSDIEKNVVAMLKKSPTVRRPSPSRLRVLKGFRRRLSRSLDSRECGAVHVDFDYLLRSAGPIAPSRLSNVSNNITITAQDAALTDATSTEEPVLLPVTSMPNCDPDIKLDEAVCDVKDEENCTVEFLDASTVELLDHTSTVDLASSEQPSPQVVMLMQDQSPTTSGAESCITEPESFEEHCSTAEPAANLESPSMEVLLDEDQSPSTLASALSSFREPFNFDNSVESPSPESRSECSESTSSLCSSCPSEAGEQADYHSIPHCTQPEVEDFQMFLSKAFNSLLKLLLVADREQTGLDYTAVPDAKMGSLEEENTEDSDQCS